MANWEKGRAAPSRPLPPRSRRGPLGWLSEDSPNLGRVETKPGLGTAAEPYNAEFVRVLIDEIAADAELVRDRSGVNQFRVGLLLLPEQIGDSSSHSLYLRFAQAQSLWLAAPLAASWSSLCPSQSTD